MANDNKDLGDFAAITPGAQQDLGDFAKITPNGGKPRSAIGEIANQFKAGLISDLPKMAGQAIQYTSDPGKPVYAFGKSITDYANEQAQRPDLQPQEADHNVVTNALAGGARMIPQSIVPAAAVGLAATGVGLPEGAALLAGSVLGAAPAGMSQAQDTLEKARAKGLPEDQALEAARKTGLIEWGGESAGEYFGGKLFGLGGHALTSGLGKQTGTAAEQALAHATETKVAKPFLHQLGETAAVETGTEMGQNAGEAAVEKQYGIDDKDPWQEAKDAIAPTLGMTALMAPFGLAGHAMNAQRQQQRNAILTAPDADQQQRTDIVNQIAPEIDAVDPTAGQNFRANAARAIASKQALNLDGSLFADPAQPSVNPATQSTAQTSPTIDPDDLPDAGAPMGPLTAAATRVDPMLPLRQDAAQKRAELRTQETGIPHEVVPHPVKAGMFGVAPVQAAVDPAAAAAPITDAADQGAAPEAPAAPVGLQPGEHVQVTLNGQDQFEHGTRITGLSPDGQYAQVEGTDAMVPIQNITRMDPAAAAALEAGAHEAATSPLNGRGEPTDAMKDAGNYKKGPVNLQGLDLMVENPIGSTRSGTDNDGTPWSTTMQNHYGYLRGTEGGDGAPIDAFIGPNPASHHVFVVDQIDQDTGDWDEHKVMLGFNSPEQAQAAYEAHYASGWQGGENITATTVDGLKDWLKQGDTGTAFNPGLFRIDQLPNRAAPAEQPAQQPAHDAPLTEDQLHAAFDQAEQELAQEKLATMADSNADLQQWAGKTKVTDDQGKPLLVYHGTGADFKDFAGLNYFTAHRGQAVDYSNNTESAMNGGKPRVIPAYLRIENPAILSGDEMESLADNPAAINRLKALGHDGAMNAEKTEILPFSPEQIRQAADEQQAQNGDAAPAAGQRPAFDVNAGVGANATSKVVDGKRQSKDPDAPKDPVEAMQHHWAWMHATSRGYNAVLDYWNRADEAGRARLQPLLDKQGELSAGHSQLYASAQQRAKIANRDQEYGASQNEHADQIDANSAKYVEGVRAEAQRLFEQADEQKAGTPEPAASRWTYRDGTPFNERDHDLYTRASQAFASVLAQEHDGGTTPALRREQLEAQVKNPGRYAQIDEVENPKGLKIGDLVTSGNSKEIETVTSITRREVNGVPKYEVHTNRPGSFGGWGNLESFNKVDPDAAKSATAPTAVDYPNRRLGFQKARSDEDAAYDPHAWANIAAANMQVGDTFQLNGKQQSVESIGDKTLKLKDADGKVRTLNPDGVAWGQFQRDLGGQLTAENLQAKNIMKPARPLIDILKRDPAVHVDSNGSVYLRDGGPVPAAKQETKAEAKPQAKALEDERPWKDSPFAARIDAVLAKLQEHDPDSVKFFRSGFAVDARDGKLTEETVAFREKKANQLIAEKTGKVTPVPFKPLDAAGLQEITGVAKALPKQIVDAALAKWNPIAEKLAALGYNHGEVDGGKPQAVRELDAQLKEIAHVLMGLAPRRYMAAKGQKVADPAKLAREEDDASRVLGINTRDYPDIDTSRQITLGQGIKDKPGQPADEQEKVPADLAEAAQVPRVQNQSKVHDYKPDQAKPLLLIACAEEKLAGRHRAIDLYQGALFDVLRKWMTRDALDPAKPALDVFVISAKHGLVPADREIDSYDQKMTAERQQELIARGQDLSLFFGKDYNEVFIAGSNLYKPVGEVYAEQLRKAGFVGHDAEIKTTDGYIGEQRGQLGEYLREVADRSAALPEHPAPLKVGVRVRIKRLTKAPVALMSLKDANRFADRVGTVEREMVQGENRYFIVTLDNTPKNVERQQEFWSGHLDVLTPAEQAGEQAPGQLATEPEARHAQIRERIDAILDKDAQLVAQGDLVKTGNRFQDFKGEYKAAFEKALGELTDSVPTEALARFHNSLKDLPGYVDRAARQFIDKHHGTQNEELTRQALKWGYTEDNTPKDGHFPDYETAVKYDNERTGKDQFSFEIQVAQAPNGQWGYSFGYQQGGKGGNGILRGLERPALTSDSYPTRISAVEAAGQAIRQDLRAHGVDNLRVNGAVLTSVKQVQEAEAAAAKFKAEDAKKRIVKGFATPEQDGRRIALMQHLADLQGRPLSNLTAEQKKTIAKGIKTTSAELGKLPGGRVTVAGALALKGEKDLLESHTFTEWLREATGLVRDKTPAELEAVYAAYRQKHDGQQPLTKEVFAQLLDQAKTEPAVKGWLGTLGDGPRFAVLDAMRKVREQSDSYLREYQNTAPRQGQIPVGGAHVDAFARGEGLATLLRQIAKGDTIADALKAAKREVEQIVTNWNNQRGDYQVHRSPAGFDTLLEDAARRLTTASKFNLGNEDKSKGAPKQDAPGTRYFPVAVRTGAAARLQQVLDGFTASRNTPEGAARTGIRSVIEELGKEKTVLDLPALLNEASGRLMRNFGAQARVLDEVSEHLEDAEHLGPPDQTAPQQAASQEDQAPQAMPPAPPDAKAAQQRQKLLRASQRELFGVLSKDPALMKQAVELDPISFASAVNKAIVARVEQEQAAGNLDPARKEQLENTVVGGKSTLGRDFTDSLYKYLKRAAKRAEKELDRDPAVYQAALVKGAQDAGVPPDMIGAFKTGFDHALAGKTKSTLPPVKMFQDGYDAGSTWMKTDEGVAWYAGKRGQKLENTGAALRRWFDESTRKIKEVTADNLPASYQIIKDQASRVEAFADVAAADATPGTKRFINAIRDNLIPFQEWLLDHGPLQPLYGEVGYREADSGKIARFLDGRAYPVTYDALGKRVSMEDATPEERLGLLQDAASTYNRRLNGLAEALAGSRTVAEAAQRFQDYTVADKNARSWASNRLTEAGKEVERLLRGHVRDFEPESYDARSAAQNENQPDHPANRKQALLVPKLDHVVREGEGMSDYRAGKDVTPQQMKDTFGFADVGFGRYVAAKQDQDHLNYAFDAFMDLANLLGINPKQIGLGGTLHFTIGALGHGRHAAHFQAKQAHPDGGTVPVINVTNTKGDGTVAHEWFHALDHALSQGYRDGTWVQHEAVQRLVRLLSTKRDVEALVRQLPGFVSGSRFMRSGRRNTPLYNTKTEDGLVKNAEHGLQYMAGKQSANPTEYKKNADVMGEDYWGNPRELLARASEAWVHDTLNGTSNYLVNPAWVGEGKIAAPLYKGAPYPMGEERKLFNDAVGALVKALRFGKDGVSLDMDAFNKAFPDVDRQYQEAIASLKQQIPSMVRAHLAEKEAIAIANQHAKNEAEREKQAQLLAAQQAREQAEREAEEARLREEAAKTEQAPAKAPEGPLSESDLEALFDQAENELAEERQEQPEAQEPGEPARAEKWTREDLAYLKKSYDAGTVFLVADPSLGLPTIHDMPRDATRHMGMGVFQTKTDQYDVNWDGGAAMRETPGGQPFTTVQIKDGRGAFLKAIGWDEAGNKLQAKLLVKNGPKAAPTLNEAQEKTAAQLIAEAAKLGVSGLDEAFKGLAKLFGGNALKSFPSGFDKYSYEEAKPHFEKALERFQAAGSNIVELFKLLIKVFGSGVRPYAIQFAKEKGLTTKLGMPTSATDRIATQVQHWLGTGQTISSKMLFETADQAYGGTQAEGKYSVKDAYDAMEAGMNRFIMGRHIIPDGSATDAVHKIGQLERWTQQLATQTRRTSEMDEYQQFSTPPAEAFVAAWVANIRAGEQVLEPSAGTGSLAIYAHEAGAQVVVNELSSRRAEVLGTVLPDATRFQENAEQLDNILPDNVKPGVVLMNPPFSSTAGRVAGERDTMNGALHLEQALKRLAPGGRLVAIVGNGMSDGKPAFKAWWNKIRQDYNVRVNIGVDGSNYAKYGTTFDNQILVIDKTGPTTGKVLTGNVKSLAELPALLEGVRNERVNAEGQDEAHDSGQPDADQRGRGEVPAGGATGNDRAGRADADPLGAGQRDEPGAAGAGASEPGQHDGAADRDGRAVGAEKRGEVPDQPGGTGRHGADGRGRGAAGERGGRSGTADREPVQRDGGERAVKGEIQVEHSDQAAAQGEMSDAIFENYTPQRLKIPGAKPHPGKLVQSAAMAAVEPPAPSYTPNLPKAVIDKGMLSLAQLEAVVYAGQAHSQMLPGNKERRGFFIGDGTGVGKGREIAGILLDNQRQGRNKAVWLSAKQGLLRDAKRDFAGVSGNADQILAHNKVKATDKLDAKSGILFTTYDTLRSGAKSQETGQAKGKAAAKDQAPGKSRLDQIVEWLGKDFDGVIAFDEAHNMGNVVERKGKRGKTKPSQKALAGVELQNRLPNARIVYVSATGATEVHNLGYATRLGLWGEGSAFAKVTDFIGGIESGGVAAMELVSRDMKAQGSYLARSLSFDGVTYDRLEHELTPLQNDIYNELARGWQTVLHNIDKALEATLQNKNPKAKSAALAQFWGSHQRFFNHVITAMQMPSIIESAQRDLDAGRAVVMQLVNTNEAEQERQAAKLANDDDAVAEDFDFTPRETLLNYVRNSFPVQQHEEYTDDEGHKLTRPVVDSQGNPVFNREMMALRDQLVKNLEQIRVPDNPLDMILRAFGTNNVAEITGRKRRFVQVPDPKTGGFKVEEQKRPASAVPADADAFMEDKKRVLVFSDAGGTGYSFQSDLNVKNQRPRSHYLVQPGWRANNAVQGFGRTHRSNEANQPHYVLPTTNLKAQKRFISSIARRLDQLGALTKGQRETGGQGMFSATDNLESQYASDALHNLFVDMYNGQAALNFHDTTKALGLNGLIDEQTGALNVSKLPDVPQFLNRLLSLETGRQDEVFEQFFRRLEENVERAKAQGTFDGGMETLRADKVEKLRDEVVYEDKRTGASTRYVELELTHPTHINTFDEVQQHMAGFGDRFLGFYRNERTGKVFALARTGTSTDPKTGQVISRGMRVQVTGGVRYGDEVDKILAGARGEKTVGKKIAVALYTPPASGALVENYATNVGSDADITDTNLAKVLATRGIERVEQTILAEPPSRKREAYLRLLERMKPHLKEVEETRQIPSFQKLPEQAARATWEREIATTPPTYTDKTHLLTGMLLPIWDRLPGDPRVVRTQTVDGERLLGRVVANSNLQQTLKNLGVGSNLSKVTPAQVMQRLQAGERGVLANGWILRQVRVSNDNRIEVSGSSLSYNRAEQDMLKNLGAFSERINWQDRVFVPTGEKGEALLTKLLQYKPLVELGKEGQEQEDEAEFSRGTTQQGMSRAQVQQTVDSVKDGWLNAPPIEVVQSVADLPFKAPADTRGASFQGKVYLVADNLGHEGEVQFVLAHEALGHIGLQAILGPEALQRELNRLRMINPELAKAARVQAATYGYDLNLATEEALADLAGQGKTINGWQKFVATVQAGLRAIGLDRVADWIERHTQAETMALLARAREAIAGKRTPRVFGQTLAARFSDGYQSPWYSQLARQVDKLPMKAAPARQWAETIMGTGFAQKGVKQDEIYWSGVLDYLAGRGNVKVTKAELQDYLAQNGVRVTESLRGPVPAPTEEGIAARKAVFDKYHDRMLELYSRMLDADLPRAERDAAEREYDALTAQRAREADAAYGLPADAYQATQYDRYTLPGGENYHELLLTLPEREPSFTLDDYIGELSDKYGWHVEGNYRQPGWTEADLTQDERDKLAALQRDEQRERNLRAGSTFQSSHWAGTSNVLAHIRFNDRLDADGNRVLHVEELQSDWGQIGKRDGFESLRRLHDDVRAEALKHHADMDAVDAAFRHIAAGPIDTAERPTTWAWNVLRDANPNGAVDLNRIHDILDNSTGKVADAPFVGKTEAWLNLALKRVLAYAAENGYDKVSFVTGQQAVDRFSLSEQVKAVEIEHAVGEPGYNVDITLLNGELHKTWATNDKDLVNLMGKELAGKAIEKLKTDPLGTARFEGDNLNLGGHGMRAFYDQIVPNAVNKLAQQLGGGRMGSVDLVRPVGPDLDRTYGTPAFDPDKWAMNDNGDVVAAQPGIEITDAMREQVRGGLPLFKRGEARLAPNGQPSNLTPRQWEQVRTPEFKAWFGDWEHDPARASKVVDSNGEPRVVYHSTHADINAFDKDKIRSPGGFWFAERRDYIDNITREGVDGFNQMPVFLNIRKPLDSGRYAMARKGLGPFDNTGVQRGLKMMGGDGVRLDNGRDSTWIALEPGQIKSAIGNAGLFERSNSDIRFSRKGEDTGALPAPLDATSVRLSRAQPAEIARAVGTTLKGVTVTSLKDKVGNNLAHYRSLGLQFLGRLQLTEMYGHLFPSKIGRNLMQHYSDTASRMDAEKTEGATRADELVRRWAKLKDEDELARLMHDSTRAEIDPSKPFQTDDDYARWKELSGRFKKLTPEAQQIFKQAAAAYDSHYAQVQQAIRDRIDRTLKTHPTRASLLSRLEAEFFGSKIKGVYFPLARFGDYVIKVNFVGRELKDGQSPAREAVLFAETLAEAEAKRAELLKEYTPEKGFEVMNVIKRAEYNAARDSVSRGFLKKLYAVLDDAGLHDPSLQDTINQLYLTSLPDLSWAKSGIHRTGMAGFSQDARRAFASHMFHGANYLAKLNHSDGLMDALEGMQKYANEHQADAGYNQVKAQQVIDEVVKRHDAYMNPKSNKLATALTSAGFVFYLGASPASALTNLLQTPVVAYPLLAARFGPIKALQALTTASKLAMQGHNDMSKILKGDELAAYKEWVRTGLVDITMAHDLAAVASGRDDQLFGHARTAMKAMSFLFHHAERFNRQATALAAYRLARDAGQNHDDAFRASVDLTKAGHFDYSAGNRPRVMQGPLAQVLFLFKQYSQNLIYTFARNAYQAAKGNREAQRALAGLLVTHFLAAGLLGLPAATTLLGAASMFGGGGDDPWDAQVALRRFLADLFGDQAGEVLAHGLSRLTPFDMSGRLGADKLIFPDVQEGLAAPDMFNQYMAGLLGPVVGMGVNAAKAVHSIARGDWERGLEMMMPAMLNAPMRAGRYAAEGVKDRTGITILPEVNPVEVAGQALGLSPSRAREAQEVKSAIYERDKALQQRRAQLLDQYATAKVKGDDTTDQMEAIRAFNQANPTRVIAGMAMARAVRLRVKHIALAKEGIYLPPKRALDARQYGDFGDDE